MKYIILNDYVLKALDDLLKLDDYIKMDVSITNEQKDMQFKKHQFLIMSILN